MRWLKSILKQYKGLPRGIYIIFLSRIVNNIGTFVFPMLTLILTQRIGITKDKAGLFITAVALFSAPSILLGGVLVDKIGRKKVLLIFQGLGALVFVTCGFLKTNMILALMLMVAQLISTISMPATDSLLADLTTQENRKEAFSLLYMGNNLGLAIGPILGGLLYNKHLKWLFIGDGITTICSLILVYLFVEETLQKIPNNVHKKSINHEKVETGNVISVLLKRKNLLFFALILFIYQFSYSQFNFALPLHLGDDFGHRGAKYFGLLAGINAVVVITFTPFLVKVTRKLKPIVIISIGGLLYAIAFGSLGWINKLPLFFISIIIMTFGEICISINTGTYIANHTPSSHRGRINGVLPMIYGAGYAIGPMIMGKYISSFGVGNAWKFIGCIMFLASIMMHVLYRFEFKKTKPNINL